MTIPRQYCTFYLDGLLCGVDVRCVQEVIRYQRLTRVPLAANFISGLINLRGQIVTAIDLRRRLALPDRPQEKLPANVVIRSEGEVMSLLVDGVGDVCEVEDDAFELPPETLRGPARSLIEGAYKLNDQLLLVLNVAELMQGTAA